MPDIAYDTKIYICISLILLLLFSAFFSGAEIAYSSIKRVKIEKAALNNNRAAKLIKKHYKSFGWTLSTIIICNNLVNILSATLTTYLFTSIFSSGVIITIMSTGIITPIIIIFGEIFPKIFAKKYAYGYLKMIVYTMEILNWLLFPITFPLSKLSLSSKTTNTEQEIIDIIDIAKEEKILEKREATLASNALRLDSVIVKSIMIPKKDIKFVKTDTSNDEIHKYFCKTGHSRLAIQNDKKEFIGIILLKDFIQKSDDSITDIIYAAPRISKNILLVTALEILRKRKAHFAFVVTSSKNTKSIIGIITLEDILEELVGEIYDEHDATDELREIGLHKFIASGNISMEKVAKKLKFDFGNNNDLNLKQWLSKKINRKIKQNLKYTYKNQFQFKVLSNKNNETTIFEIEIK